MYKEKKVTLATIKSFVKRELKNNNLHINVKNKFDGMIDCVTARDGDFTKAVTSPQIFTNNVGIEGIWFVGQSRDYFKPYEDDNYIGYTVSNCCGSFIVAMRRLYI